MLKGRNYIDPTNFSMAELDEVMDLAKKVKLKDRILFVLRRYYA